MIEIASLKTLVFAVFTIIHVQRVLPFCHQRQLLRLRIIFCVLILTLEILGGMNSVVLTDVIQCIVTGAACLVACSCGSSNGVLGVA